MHSTFLKIEHTDKKKKYIYILCILNECPHPFMVKNSPILDQSDQKKKTDLQNNYIVLNANGGKGGGEITEKFTSYPSTITKQ